MYRWGYVPPPPRDIKDARFQMMDALWEHWYGNTPQGMDILVNIANFVAERTLDGETFEGPAESGQKEGYYDVTADATP